METRNRAQERADEIKAERAALKPKTTTPRPHSAVLDEHVAKVTAARGSR